MISYIPQEKKPAIAQHTRKQSQPNNLFANTGAEEARPLSQKVPQQELTVPATVAAKLTERPILRSCSRNQHTGKSVESI